MEKNINIYFYNTLCSDPIFDMLFHKYNVKSGNSAQNFFKLLAEGFNSDPNVNIHVVSLLPVNSAEQKKIFWNFCSENENNIKYEYIPLVNLPLLRNLLSNLFVLFKILSTKFPKNSDHYILVDFLRFSINTSVVIACKLKGIRVITVVTDMPGLDVLHHSLLAKIRNRLIFFFKYDFYVCLTRQLNDVLNVNQKPSLIIEGFINAGFKNISNNLEDKYEERVIIYAGSLYEQYGIRTLIEAFKLVPDFDLRLWLYGTGPFADHIAEYSDIDDRIQYKGIVLNSELISVLIRSTLLVNPRPTNEAYTKYSFPSKNLEYMSTGTPLLTTRLPGMPSDHYPYVYFIEDDSITGIYKGLTNVLSQSRSVIHEFGLSSKEFTLREKSNTRQAEKIVNLLRTSI